MSKIKVSRGDAPELEDGVYPATCIGVKDDILENPRFGDGAVVKLLLRLDDTVNQWGDEIELDAMASAKVSPMSKLVRWATALGIKVPFDDPDYEFDTDELVGKKCLVSIVHKEGSEWPRVEDLTQLPKAPRIRSGDVLSEFWEESRKRGIDRKSVARVINQDWEMLQSMDRDGLWNLFTLLEQEDDGVPFEPVKGGK